MIKFPCKCGSIFNLTEDLAGGEVQCPRCGLLASVPTLNDLSGNDLSGNDLSGINPDGTFGFSPVSDQPIGTHRPQSAAQRAQSIGNYDQLTQMRVAPRYDPVTGELIRPMQFADEEPVPVLSIGVEADASEIDAIPVPVISIPAMPKLPVAAIGYAVGDARKHVTFLTLAMELLMPANVIVLFFVFLLYVAGYYTTFAIHHFAEDYIEHPWPLLLINIPMWLIIAQAGCVIEYTGQDAVEELPRPLRDFSLGEDVVGPLFHAICSALICFAPALVLLLKLDPANPMTIPIVMVFSAVGSFFFPAILLTTVTGSVLANLRPDRVLGVIKQCGIAYIMSVAAFILAAVPSIYYLTGKVFFHPPANSFFQHIDSLPLALPMLAISVYLLHFFCWQMGLMYRENHARFPWLAQRHIKVTRPARATATAVSK